MNMPLDRRETLGIIAGGVALSLAGTHRAMAQAEAPDQDDKLITEPQFGDPVLTAETLTYNPIEIQRKTLGAMQANFEPRITEIRTALIAGAIGQLGKNRVNNRPEISKWFQIFDLPFALDGKPLPFCATGLSFVAALLYAKQAGTPNPTVAQLKNYLGDVDHHHFYPTPSVLDMKLVAQGKRRWIARSAATGSLAPRPGWLVVYDWNGDGHPDHVGLVERLDGASLHTIEFNTSDTNATNGGAVARKTRPLGSRVQGFIRPELTRLT